MDVQFPYGEKSYIIKSERDRISKGEISEDQAFTVTYKLIDIEVDTRIKDNSNRYFEDRELNARMASISVGSRRNIIANTCITGWKNLNCAGKEVPFKKENFSYILSCIDEIAEHIESESYLKESQGKN